MLIKKFIHIIYIVFFLFLSDVSFAQERSLSLIVESEYFSIYGDKDMDIEALLKRINFNYLLRVESFTDGESADIKTMLAKTMDALYSEVSDILGINIYSYHGELKLFPSQVEITEISKQYIEGGLKEASFYLHNNNTLYVSCSDVTLGILGHEIAHAIISHYFVVPPPAKVQEVLSGYVEYNLRKSTGTLP